MSTGWVYEVQTDFVLISRNPHIVHCITVLEILHLLSMWSNPLKNVVGSNSHPGTDAFHILTP